MVNAASKGSLPLTNEQKLILESSGDIRINAVAGSGKTTTIIEYARTRPPGSSILYLAFNKSVKLDAGARFQRMGITNIKVETAHSLAYKSIVIPNGFKIKHTGYLIHELVDILRLRTNGEQHSEFVLASHINRFVNYFCNSDALSLRDLDYKNVIQEEKVRAFVKSNYQFIETCAMRFLNMMESQHIDITHDFYLKKYQLSAPRLDYDYILFDEAQDASAAMLDVVLSQQATKVIVGDTHQQIYGWRHAVNSLERAQFPTFQLSNSFRFNQIIADLASQVLRYKSHLMPHEEVLITGSALPGKIISKAVIARTNLGLLLKAIEYITEKSHIKQIYFEGNINSYTYADEGASLYDVLNLHNGKQNQIRDKLIREMKSLEDLEDYIEKAGDGQLGMMVEIVKKYGNEIPGILRKIKMKHVENSDRNKAQVIFSTVHRCKGMEYDEIEIVNDFINEEKIEKMMRDSAFDKSQIPKIAEEINLLYVAVTRTRCKISIHESLLPKAFPVTEQIKVVKTPKMPDADVMAMFQKDKVNLDELKLHLEKKLSTLDRRREKHKAAYMPWSAELDEMLTEYYCEGQMLHEIAGLMGRSEGAILSRIQKLGLEELYGDKGLLD